MKKILYLLLFIPFVLNGQSKKISELGAATSVTGTELIPIVQGGVTKSVTPNVLNTYALGVFNVKTYGATADGSDETTDLQAALTAGIGGVVYIPKGTYHITASLEIGANTTVMGAGRDNTIIFADTSFTDGDPMITFLDGTKDVTIRDLCIDGNKTAFTSKKGEHHGISNYNNGYMTAENINLINVEIKNTSLFGIWITDNAKKWSLENCYIHLAGDTIHAGGMFVSPGIDLKINSCVIDSSYEHGIYYASGNEAIISNSFFRHNGHAGVGAGISMRADSNVVISGNQILYNNDPGLVINSNRENLAIGGVKNIVVTGNTITHNQGGIEGSSQAQVLLMGVNGLNFSNNNLGHGIGGYAVKVGIRFIGESKNISIKGNDFYSPYGIWFNSTDSLDNISIKNNDFRTGNHSVDNFYGIRLSSVTVGDNMEITGNTFNDSEYGVRIESAFPTGLTIKNNVFNEVTYPVENDGSITAHNIEYKGSSAFTTTSDRKAIFIDGLNTDYDATVTADQGSDGVHPVVEDLMSAYCKADSLIVKRVAGTGGTSGLKFKYVINND